MTRPKRALLLAAGFGTRLRPLTHSIPKPLLPFWGRPMVEHTLDLLASWGVREVLLNVHHGADALLRWATALRHPRLRITLSFEPDILGTGGPLVQNAWYFANEPFWICNGDVIAQLSPAPLLRAMEKNNPLAVLWMLPDRGPRTVRVSDQHIVDFADPQPGSEGTMTFSGLHLARPEFLSYLPPTGFSSSITGYQKAMAAGERIQAVAVPGSYWNDLGTPESLLNAHAETVHAAWLKDARTLQKDRRAALEKQGVHFSGWVALGQGVQGTRGARLENCVLADQVQLSPRSHVQDAIVAEGSRVSGPLQRLACPLKEAVTPVLYQRLEKAGWSGQTLAVCPAPRGSDRQFTRIMEGARRAFLVVHGNDRPENDHYVTLARALARKKVRVPKVLAHWPALRATLWEDLGDLDLLCALQNASPYQRKKHYQKALKLALHFHRQATAMPAGTLPLQPPFDEKLFAWEHALFIDRFAIPEGAATPAEVQALQKELGKVAEVLLQLPQVIVHRDLQSTNIIFHRGEAALIDFQGMRLGPQAYDWASLLADPYVALSWPEQMALLDTLPGAGESLRSAYAYGCVQRLAQALGAYGRLSALPGTRRFRQWMQPGIRQFLAAAQALGHLPACVAFAQKAETILAKTK